MRGATQISLKRPSPGSELAGERHQGDLPSLISSQVEEHMERLETRFLDKFRELQRNAAEKSAQALTDHLYSKVETLEQISAIQSRTIVKLKNASKVAERSVNDAVASIERTISNSISVGIPVDAAQGEPGNFVAGEIPGMEGMPVRKYAFCPSCTSSRIRRANRDGVWEEFLRLFFIAPFRCRACRHKFYRF